MFLTAQQNQPKLWNPSIVEAEAIRTSLRKFAKECWPQVESAPLTWGWHLDALCDHLAYVTLGDIRFLMVNEPPRMTKSLVTSVIYPVWDWLHDPSVQHLTASYALQLAMRDTLRSRRLMDSQWFQKRWGHEFRFAFDEKLKRQYSNNKGGRRVATSPDSAATGEGGNRIILDDPHNAAEIESDAIRIGTHTWWDESMSSRLNQPERDGWIMTGQRTGADDLFAHVMKTYDMSQIVHLILPNEYEPKRKCITYSPTTGKEIFRDPRTKPGELLCPARVGPKATARQKKVMKGKYPFQYQQADKVTEGTILSAANWRLWEGELPECESVLVSIDTAFEEKQQNDYSATTTWGVFRHSPMVMNEDTGEMVKARERKCIILLGAWRDKLAYHKLKRYIRKYLRKCKTEFGDAPDWVLVEKKASGIVLCQDLGRAKVRGLRKVSLDHGGRVKNDKVARANLVSPVLDDGLVYYVDRKWAQAVIDECAAFPDGDHDDWVDTCLMAWQFLRRMNEVKLWEHESEDGTIRLFKKAKRASYG